MESCRDVDQAKKGVKGGRIAWIVVSAGLGFGESRVVNFGGVLMGAVDVDVDDEGRASNGSGSQSERVWITGSTN